MALAALNTTLLSQHTAFCPPPLHIQKKPRRATFRKRVFRKSNHHHHIDQHVNGPLDDIINEIRNNIWQSPFDYSAVASSLELTAPPEVPLSWTVTPLPVSRLPSHRPLTVRKNRESRSSGSASASASGSSMGYSTYFSRGDSQDDTFNGGPVDLPSSSATTAWPLLNMNTSYDCADASSVTGAAGLLAREAFEATDRVVDERIVPTKRRPSVLRLFPGLSRLRRTDTGETSGSSGDTSSLASPTLLEIQEDQSSENSLQEPSDDAVEAYIRKNARK